jgi:hypothetical protein
MWNSLRVDIDLLLTLVDHMEGRVRYEMGAKAPRLDCDSALIHSIDCSGAARYLLARCAGEDISDGSWNQHQYFARHDFKPCQYKNAGLMDGRLRIAFMNPEHDEAGHVWLILNGRTIESRGGKGIDRRSWRTAKLAREVDACYVVTGA